MVATGDARALPTGFTRQAGNVSTLFRLDGRRALVVGAAAGIGRSAAIALAAHGAYVISADRDMVGAEMTAAETGGEPLALDVLDRAGIKQAAIDFADVEVLVFTPATNVRRRLVEYSDEEFERIVNVNLRAAFDFLRAFGEPMGQRGLGSIIGFTSIRSMIVEPGQGIYSATKAGIVQLVKTAASELGPLGVRVNAIAPGVVETPMTAPLRKDKPRHAAYAAHSALERWGQPEELAGAVVYLASDASSYVTGSTLIVDGGWTAIDGRYDPPE